MGIIDHITLNVTDYTRSKAFYDKALKPLGVSLLKEFGDVGGFGKDHKPELWLAVGKPGFTPTHLCFAASNRAEVDAFYKAAIEAGGKDNGAPGLRPHYHANYYGAFVIDPNGHNIEAVYHGGRN